MSKTFDWVKAIKQVKREKARREKAEKMDQEKLREMKEVARQAYAHACSFGKYEYRVGGLMILYGFMGKEILELAAEAIYDPEPKVRECAAAILGQVSTVESLEVVMKVLKTEQDPSVKKRLEKAFCHFFHPDSREVGKES